MKRLYCWLAIFGLLLAVRFAFSTIIFNNDFYNYQNWVNSLKADGFTSFYHRDFSPWTQANYPPLINIFFWTADNFYNFFNIKNSNILVSFYKLPALIIETILIALLIKRKQIIEAVIIALSPAIFYNTVFWGQTDGAVAALLFLSLTLLSQKKLIWAAAVFTVSILIKQAALIILPIFLIASAKLNFKKTLMGVGLSLSLIWISFFPFLGRLDLIYPFTFFSQALQGLPHQHLASVNAFNLWYLLGQNDVSDQLIWLGLSFHQWGRVLALVFIGAVILKLLQKKSLSTSSLLAAAGLTNFTAFLFLTRMHERHLLPSLVLLIPFAIKSKARIFWYSLISLAHLTNIIWVWGEKQLPFIPANLSSYIITALTLTTLSGFIYFFYQYLNPFNQKSLRSLAQRDEGR